MGMNPSTHRLPPPQVVSFVYERGWRQGFAWAGEVQRRAGQQGGAAGCCATGRTRTLFTALFDSYSSEAAPLTVYCRLPGRGQGV